MAFYCVNVAWSDSSPHWGLPQSLLLHPLQLQRPKGRLLQGPPARSKDRLAVHVPFLFLLLEFVVANVGPNQGPVPVPVEEVRVRPKLQYVPNIGIQI